MVGCIDAGWKFCTARCGCAGGDFGILDTYSFLFLKHTSYETSSVVYQPGRDILCIQLIDLVSTVCWMSHCTGRTGF